MIENKNENFDMTEIDRIFEKFPAPEPSPALVDEIKRKISLRKKRASIPVLIFKTVITTAAVILISVFFMYESKETKPSQPTAQISLTQVDDNIAALEKEIELLSSELYALRLNEDNTSSSFLSDTITNAEADFYEIDSSFWKG
ncbi:MAG: hypothetical protein A2Y10_15850 [Planctomycetes bacterium GWF2_41_51]|nr:MAG: hypothetical protein A2Y10_15850 [Planctomycetes bacterium GWF2_41_51]HBG27594.1 hypothetical protein [Phycisphaerales bacterium]